MPETEQLRQDVANLNLKVAQLTTEVSALTKSTGDLVEAWQAATGFLRFMKWVSGFAAAVAALWYSVLQIRGH